MSNKGIVRVHLESGYVKADFEGDAEQVFESILRFLSQVYPNIELIQKIVFTPDLVKMMNDIASLVEITQDGPIISSDLDLPAKSAICLTLLGAYIGNKIGRLRKETLSTSELSKLTGKAKKTVSNEIPKLVEDGLVEKASEGEYRITPLGIRKTEEVAEAIKRGKT
ncbi:winged helix-turn-helix transcriptional regulator [Candidatus Bathyarchaeota archaeon]|nr:winged helix-turn-helix transcriptional regulator [Candidatus Bathyarchaeota archaeon]